MSGLPCSGKSTYIKENLISRGYKVLSFDNFIMERFETDIYNKAWSRYMNLSDAEKRIIRLEIDIQFRDWLLSEENIAIDFTNLTKEIRNSWLSIVPVYYRTEVKFFTEKFETILERNSNRKGKFIPLDVLSKMLKTQEEDISNRILS
jgi:tRNA uridine 5-carbamoylmethylation protein Kti12